MYAEMTKEEAARQRDWLNRAFGLATEAAAAAAGVDVKEGNEALRQQQEWLGRAFGVDTSGNTFSTPRYEVNDSDEEFQVSMDVPGVKQSDIDINLEENVLTISGERQMGRGDVTRKSTFSKSFTLDSTVEADKITAKLNNGVLLVTAPKDIPVPDVKKIPIMQVEDDDEEDDVVADAEVESSDADADKNDESDADDKEKEA
jgi:HSP20 family molecular chaperone IbpA